MKNFSPRSPVPQPHHERIVFSRGRRCHSVKAASGTSMILYLHGFRSSPQSFKAQLLRERLAQRGRAAEFLCPQLPTSPAAVVDLLEGVISDYRDATVCIIGSSLGGYYATWLAERTGWAAVLLNPAVRPQRDLVQHLSPMPPIVSQDLAELEPLWVPTLTRLERYFVLCAKGDEVLDWREMVERYAGARFLVLDGGNHALSNFDEMIDSVLSFAGIPSPAP